MKEVPRSNFINYASLEAIPCPHCLKGVLHLEEELHLLMRDDPAVPSAGSMVHINVDERGKITMPDVWQSAIQLEPGSYSPRSNQRYVVEVLHSTLAVIQVRILHALEGEY